MSDLNEDEVFEKKESKIKPMLQKIFKNKKNLIILMALIIVIFLAIIGFVTGLFSNLLSMITGAETSTSNIQYGGYAIANGNYIYYVSPDENMEKTNIYKTKKDGTESEIIYKGYDIRSLNIINNKLYFISIETKDISKETEDDEEIENEEDYIDVKIYKMNLDGSDLKVINDNELSYEYAELFAIKNKLYYIGKDYNVYEMDLNGGKRKLVVESGTGLDAINKDYIIYDKVNDNDEYITYIKNLKNNTERQISSERIYSPNIYKGNIYYLTEDEKLIKSPVNGGDETVLLEKYVQCPNIYKNNIYYMDYKNETEEDYTICIYKLNVNGGEPQIVKEFDTYSSFFNIIDDKIFYMDMNNSSVFINLLNINDLSEKRLCEWDYDALNTDEDYDESDTEDITNEEFDTDEDIEFYDDEDETEIESEEEQ